VELFVVGGAVRDALLGRPQSDRDWVAVGATPQQMVDLGYRPVGRDFPVFLHPHTHEEVALARTERKTAAGYHGFQFHAAPDVTLEEDLARRDLTINAMAQDAQGRLIDPYGGARDLRDGVLRHVSPAFAEDPVRLLRLARFAARFPHFTIAPETMHLARALVAAGEVDALVPERVWQELARGLMEPAPGRLWAVLHDTGALPRLAPGAEALMAALPSLQRAAEAGEPLAVRLAVTLRPCPDPAAVARHWRAPAEAIGLVDLLHREGAATVALSRHLQGMSAQAPAPEHDEPQPVRLAFDRTDAWRRPERFAALLRSVVCSVPDTASALDAWHRALAAAQAVDTAAVAARAAAAGQRGPAVGAAIARARDAAVALALS
jgi:tRNA nucleotidyltransferase (CCA-adding enzyme)